MEEANEVRDLEVENVVTPLEAQVQPAIPLIPAGTAYPATAVARSAGIATVKIDSAGKSYPLAPGQKVQVALADVGMLTAAHPIIDAFNGQREVISATASSLTFKDVGEDLGEVLVNGRVTVE